MRIILFMMMILMGCTRVDKTCSKIDEPVYEIDLSKENKDDKEKIYDKENIDQYIINFNYDRKDMLSQRLVLGMEGTTLDDSNKDILRRFKPGAIILFNRNIIDESQLIALISDIRKLCKDENIINPFIFIDQEGGRVDRLKDIYKPMSSAAFYAQNDKIDEYIEDIDIRMKRYDINSPLAPVLDTNDSASSGAIGDRAFSNDYKKNSAIAKKIIDGFHEKNILSIAKHFPGHGATTVDSHYALPVIDKTIDELKNSDMIPFIDNSEIVDGIMLAHILIPNVDERPVSLSDKWVQFIRDELKYNGLILSDDITMGALDEFGKLDERAYSFLNSGGDMVLICHNPSTYDLIFKRLESLDDENIKQSFDRIMKKKLEIFGEI